MSNTGLFVVGLAILAVGALAFTAKSKSSGSSSGKPGTRQKLETLSFGSKLIRDEVSAWGAMLPDGTTKTTPPNG